jgi:uncharacterized protein YcfL
MKTEMKTILKLIVVYILITSCSTYKEVYITEEQKLKMLQEYLIQSSETKYNYKSIEPNFLQAEKEVIIEKKLARKPKKQIN